jgi:hypothetical protein
VVVGFGFLSAQTGELEKAGQGLNAQGTAGEQAAPLHPAGVLPSQTPPDTPPSPHPRVDDERQQVHAVAGVHDGVEAALQQVERGAQLLAGADGAVLAADRLAV